MTPKFKKGEEVYFTVKAKIKMTPVKDSEGKWFYPFKQEAFVAVSENDLKRKKLKEE